VNVMVALQEWTELQDLPMPETWTYVSANGQTLLLSDVRGGVELLGHDGTGLPPLEVHHRKAPFQRGQTVIAARKMVRHFVTYHGIDCDSLPQLLSLQRQIAAIIDGELGQGVMTVETALGDTRAIGCVMVQGGDWTKDGLTMFARQFTLTWEADEPTWYDPADQVLAFASVSAGGGGLMFPQAFPWSFGVGQATIGVDTLLDYPGSAATQPLFVLTGPLAGPVLLHVEQQKQVYFPAYTVPAGQTLTVDFRWGAKTAVQTGPLGTFNVISQMASDSQFWEIKPGVLNHVLVAAGPGSTGTAVMHFLARYNGL
jgi:hypothetical protein